MSMDMDAAGSGGFVRANESSVILKNVAANLVVILIDNTRCC